MGDTHRSTGSAHPIPWHSRGWSRQDGYALIAAAPPYAATISDRRAWVRDESRPPMHSFVIGDSDYPEGLRALASCPTQLHCLGMLTHPPARSVAIVGSRAASPYGRSMADRLARDLAALGYAVVSGLARGIDAAAHIGALAVDGVTVAVLPSALTHITPPQHAALAARIPIRGALVTEIAAGGPFGRGAFVKRNRIIAALSGVTVVVEAGAASGALRTAEAARALGRPVLAVPGDVDRPTSFGTLQLLRAGAHPCGDAGDILAALQVAFPSPPAVDPLSRLTQALTSTPRTVEQLAVLAALSAPETNALLLRLGWTGVALSEPGGRWRRRGQGAR